MCFLLSFDNLIIQKNYNGRCAGALFQVRDVEAVVKRFKTDLHNCVGFIQEPKKLKENVKTLYQKYVQDETVRSYLLLV